MIVQFHFQKHVKFTNRLKLKKFLNYLIENEKANIHSLNFVFCSDTFLLQINKDYLNHDFLTDIITFDLGNKSDGIMGEIYISVDRVKDNALQFKVTPQTELLRVIFHGVLHLCGYGDKSKSEILKMRAKEDRYIKEFLKY